MRNPGARQPGHGSTLTEPPPGSPSAGGFRAQPLAPAARRHCRSLQPGTEWHVDGPFLPVPASFKSPFAITICLFICHSRFPSPVVSWTLSEPGPLSYHWSYVSFASYKFLGKDTLYSVKLEVFLMCKQKMRNCKGTFCSS